MLLSLTLVFSLPAQILRCENRFEDGERFLGAPLSDIDGEGVPEYFGLVDQGGVVSGIDYSMEKQQALVNIPAPPLFHVCADDLFPEVVPFSPLPLDIASLKESHSHSA